MATIPKLGEYKTEWNLKMLYASLNDAGIVRDVKKIEAKISAFARKYRKNKRHLSDERALLKALEDYEALLACPEGSKPIMYLSYVKELNSHDQQAEAMLNKYSDRLTKAENSMLFFTLELGKVDKAQQSKFLKSPLLAPYRYFLSNLFEASKYDLSEAEEKILNLKSLTSRRLWVQGVEKVLNKQIVIFNGKELPIAQAMNTIPQLALEERRTLHNLTLEKLRDMSDFAESEINALVLDKKIDDELRGFKHPYSRTVLHYENDEASVMNLVRVVSRFFSISHRFYALKAQMLKLPYLEYADRSANVGETSKKIPFIDATDTVRHVFYGVHRRYGEIFDRFLREGQIDVYPKPGKSAGAFCSSSINLPTYVLLNQVDDFHSLSTLAHEMGHAIHSERSKEQRPLYQHYTTSVAETASTLFENILFHAVFKDLPKDEQVVALHDKLHSDISSISRQIACFNFELELHTQIREQGALSKEEIAKLLNAHMQAYLGPAMKLSENDGYFFVYWSHLRRFFYVYSYAYGELISRALYERYKQDPAYIEAIDRFLSAGGSKKPEAIFKGIGIDTKDPSFFTSGLKSIEADVDTLETLLRGT